MCNQVYHAGLLETAHCNPLHNRMTPGAVCIDAFVVFTAVLANLQGSQNLWFHQLCCIAGQPSSPGAKTLSRGF